MKDEIVFLARGIPHHGLGGMEIVVWDLAREFVRLGHKVRVITTSIPNVSSEFIEDGVVVVPLGYTKSNCYTRAWWSESRQYFETHCMSSTMALISVSAAGFGLLPIKNKLNHIPFIMQAHGTSWGEVLSKWGSRRFLSILSSARNLCWLPKDLMAYRKFDAIVAVGERVFQDLTSPPVSWAVSKSNIYLISNGIDTNLFYPSDDRRIKIREQLNIKMDIPVILSASRLHSQKGLANGLRAFKMFLRQQPDAIYLIAGDGSDRKQLELLTDELAITKHVFFLGALRRDELAEWMSAADVFLFLTDRIEGLPLNVLEALASGLPSIISEHLQIYVTPAISLVNQRKPEIVCAELVRVSSNVKRQQEIFLIDDYTLSISAQHYINLVDNLALAN